MTASYRGQDIVSSAMIQYHIHLALITSRMIVKT
jgi:hypothetical protein